MRYILGLCVVLAVGNPAWTSEMGTIAGEPGYQTPAATVTSAVTQATGTAAYTRDVSRRCLSSRDGATGHDHHVARADHDVPGNLHHRDSACRKLCDTHAQRHIYHVFLSDENAWWIVSDEVAGLFVSCDASRHDLLASRHRVIPSCLARPTSSLSGDGLACSSGGASRPCRSPEMRSTQRQAIRLHTTLRLCIQRIATSHQRITRRHMDRRPQRFPRVTSHPPEPRLLSIRRRHSTFPTARLLRARLRRARPLANRHYRARHRPKPHRAYRRGPAGCHIARAGSASCDPR